ncbi:MAG: NlpC/P60 family protein [Actinomycetia bacterium]|nr:NlpC/P60 family protein [Actinomycetes bacterium]
MRSTFADNPWRAALVLTIAFILVLGTVPASGEPANAAIEKKKAEAGAAQSALDAMANDLEVQVEAYNAISEALDKTREEIRTTQADLDTAARDLSAARGQLGERAASIYKEGNSSAVGVLLGTTSFDDFVSRLDLLTRINQSDADLVRQVKDTKTQVEDLQAALESREAEQVALRTEAEQRAKDIETRIAKQKSYVASLNAEVKSLMKAEAERQAKLAAERAAQAAALASKNSGGGRPSTAEGDLTTGHPEVVSIALQYLGVPYRWGGATPSGFDCSGLCQYVYRQIGIALPRASRGQYSAGSHIAPDRLDLLRPGDLVFFGTGGDPGRVHHVGIYVGNGNFVHAPSTGDVVKVSSLTERIAANGDYVGASRF